MKKIQVSKSVVTPTNGPQYSEALKVPEVDNHYKEYSSVHGDGTTPCWATHSLVEEDGSKYIVPSYIWVVSNHVHLRCIKGTIQMERVELILFFPQSKMLKVTRLAVGSQYLHRLQKIFSMREKNTATW